MGDFNIRDEIQKIANEFREKKVYERQVNEFCGIGMKVVHCKKESYDVYIGRPSKWGNPFTHIKDKKTKAEFIVDSREEAIQKYREWILNQPQLLNDLHELRDKVLGCWCKPQSCHGDVLKELVEKKFLWMHDEENNEI